MGIYFHENAAGSAYHHCCRAIRSGGQVTHRAGPRKQVSIQLDARPHIGHTFARTFYILVPMSAGVFLSPFSIKSLARQ